MPEEQQKKQEKKWYERLRDIGIKILEVAVPILIDKYRKRKTTNGRREDP